MRFPAKGPVLASLGRSTLLLAAPLVLASLAAAAGAQAIFSDGFESGDTGVWSTVVAPSSPLRLLVLGDTGEGNIAQYCVAEGMAARCTAAGGGCSAVLLAGDNFYDEGVQSTDDSLWTTAFESVYDRSSLNGLPFYPVLGEHDYVIPALQPVFASAGIKQAQIDYSFLPVGAGAGQRASDKWSMSAAWYDVVLGNGLVHLFALDTQDTAGGMPADQPDDMQARVAASTATWKLVLGHFPRYTSGDHQTALLLLDVYLPSPGLFGLQEAVYCGADLYLSGHDHDRELIDKGQDSNCPDTYFLISGAGSKVSTASQAPLAKSLFFDDTVEGFALLEATPSSLRIEMWDSNSVECDAPTLAFTHTIQR